MPCQYRMAYPCSITEAPLWNLDHLNPKNSWRKTRMNYKPKWSANRSYYNKSNPVNHMGVNAIFDTFKKTTLNFNILIMSYIHYSSGEKAWVVTQQNAIQLAIHLTNQAILTGSECQTTPRITTVQTLFHLRKHKWIHFAANTFENSSSGIRNFFCICNLTSANVSPSWMTKKNGSPKFWTCYCPCSQTPKRMITSSGSD